MLRRSTGTAASSRASVQSGGGRAQVRRALYMACWVVIRHNKDFCERYKALRAQGKCAKVAVVACMRVLIVRLNAMLRTGTPWKEQIAHS
nr:transposase [Pseudomonas protegens]